MNHVIMIPRDMNYLEVVLIWENSRSKKHLQHYCATWKTKEQDLCTEQKDLKHFPLEWNQWLSSILVRNKKSETSYHPPTSAQTKKETEPQPVFTSDALFP